MRAFYFRTLYRSPRLNLQTEHGAALVGEFITAYHNEIIHPAKSQTADREDPENAGTGFPNIEAVSPKEAEEHTEAEGHTLAFL